MPLTDRNGLINLMPYYQSINFNKGRNYFWTPDTKDLFEKNRKTQPADWVYHTKQITYDINSLGYRAPEFDQVDWNNSLVIFGCSHVFGTGVSVEHTISSQLSKIIGLPVINLGVPGSSLYFGFVNLVGLVSSGIRPKGIINCWTEYHRFTRFRDDDLLSLLGVWSENRDPFYYQWNQHEANSTTYALTVKTSIELLCESLGIWHAGNSYFKDTADLFACDYLPHTDRGRDLNHPGIRGHKLTAVRLASSWHKTQSKSQ